MRAYTVVPTGAHDVLWSARHRRGCKWRESTSPSRPIDQYPALVASNRGEPKERQMPRLPQNLLAGQLLTLTCLLLGRMRE